MMTRNKTRIALAELPQQQQVQPVTAFIKPPKSRKPDWVPVESLPVLVKRMNVISLDSSSEDYEVPLSERKAIDLSQSAKGLLEISSSSDDDGDESLSSEDQDEDVDGDESELSEDDSDCKQKSSSATPASKLRAGEVAKLILGGDPKKVKADDCRAYLRHYGLRISGTKPVLVDRIKQHIELQGGGSRNYNRSTFTINCTGDVCKGDVVIFDQKVYDKSSGSAAQARSRTVAGRVVKESYGAQRQQHTFTVEVLWSKGFHPLAPMKQLLVKGRNLYKRRTFRQRWADEGERGRSLAEKHKRGDAARQVRARKQGRLRVGSGSGGRYEAEVPFMKQLANPYADTLAWKENTTNGPLFQSSVRTPEHLVHNQPLIVPAPKSIDADTVPYGEAKHFRQHAENSGGNRVYVPVRKSIGADNVPYGEAKQFRQHGESSGVNRRYVPVPKSTGADTVPFGEVIQFRRHEENFDANRGILPLPKSTGANAVPLGKVIQVRQHATKSDVNRGYVPVPKSTGANTVPLGKVRQFRQHAANADVNRVYVPVLKSTVANELRSVHEHAANADSNRVYVPVLKSPVANELRSVQDYPTFSKKEVPHTGFPCPTESCTYRGSKVCTSNLCYHCCKRKGGPCPNPNHRPPPR